MGIGIRASRVQLAALAVVGASLAVGRAQGAEAGEAGTVDANPFFIESSDGQNALRIGGLVQADGRYFADDSTSSSANTWLVRRIRPIIEGTLDGIFDFRIMPDFGGGKSRLVDAYVTAHFAPFAALTAGKFKVPVGLEEQQSAADLRFIERGLPSDLVPNRDVGVRLAGELAGGTVAYAIGYFNGVADGASSDSNPAPDLGSAGKGDWAARAFLQPFRRDRSSLLSGLGFGVGGTYARAAGSAATSLLPSYQTVGQQTFFSYRGSTAATSTAPAATGTYASGERLRWTPQLYYAVRNVSLSAEYVHVSQGVARAERAAVRSALLVNTGWQAQAAWFITGEKESFKGFEPRSTFAVGKPGWGAFELVARVSELTVDSGAFEGGGSSFADPVKSARRARDVGVGANWYWSSNVKWALSYDRTRFDGGGPAGTDRPDEKALLVRLQLAF